MVQIVQLILWELVIPVIVGTLFLGVNKRGEKLPFLWCSGQMLLWAVFQAICVPLILLEWDFEYLVWIYTALAAVLIAASLLLWRRRKKLGHDTFYIFGKPHGNFSKTTWVLWAVFWCVLLFQLVQAVRMTYGDGDDAYYVATTTITNNADTMYRKLAYTGGPTDLDARHGLAPFPIWISYLVRVSGLEAATTAHIAVPLMLIAMTYGVFYLIGEKIFGNSREKIPLFLIFAEMLVLFGDYSFYTAENFMIARSRQGKAALGSIMIPMLFFLLILLMERLQEGKKVALQYWVLLLSVMTMGCMCSTLGALLGCMLAGVAGICGAVCFRKWRFLIPMAACCVPCVFFALLYLRLD